VPGPVDGDHALLLRIALPVCHAYGLALAGGYAIRAHGLVSRPSDDLDLATAATTPVQEIIDALAEAYRAAGLAAEVLGAHGRKGHLTVALPAGATHRVDVLKEPLSRPPIVMDVGPVLSLEDAVALKVGALHDRGLPRDLIDVHAATTRFGNAELLALGRLALDADFFPEDLRDQLDRAAMYGDQEFGVYGVRRDEIAAIRAWAQAWSDELNEDLAERAAHDPRSEPT
jgi:hypothetical protein